MAQQLSVTGLLQLRMPDDAEATFQRWYQEWHNTFQILPPEQRSANIGALVSQVVTNVNMIKQYQVTTANYDTARQENPAKGDWDGLERLKKRTSQIADQVIMEHTEATHDKSPQHRVAGKGGGQSGSSEDERRGRGGRDGAPREQDLLTRTSSS